MPGVDSPTVHQLKIGLEGTTPPLWRRLQIPSAASLGFLHDVIQRTFGWKDYHLHRFHDERGREWGDRESSSRGGFGAAAFANEEEVDLGKVLRAEGSVLWYVYDFGDNWRHRIEVEKVAPCWKSSQRHGWHCQGLQPHRNPTMSLCRCCESHRECRHSTGGVWSSYAADCGHSLGACPTGREYACSSWMGDGTSAGESGCASNPVEALWSIAVGVATTIELPGSDDSYTLSDTDPNDGANESTGHYYICYN